MRDEITTIPYICYETFDGMSMVEETYIEKGTECICINDFVAYDEKPVCVKTSENAHIHFTRNDDGKGLERGELIKDIRSTLSIRDDEYQERWDKIWEDDRCRKYKKTTLADPDPDSDEDSYLDTWLWGHDFYIAPVEDLEYIKNLIS